MPIITFHMKTPLVLTLLQNLCCGSRLVHICNHGVHGFLFLHVLLKKHMKTQLILTILNFSSFFLFWISKNLQNTFVTRLRWECCPASLLLYVCGGFNHFFFTFSFASIYQPQSACQNQPTKRNFSQRTVKPQRR